MCSVPETELDDWYRSYKEKYLKDILDKVDPFVKYCFRTFLPLLNRFSEQFDKNISNNTQEKKLLEEENFKKMKMTK